MNTTKHNKAYATLIFISLMLEATRVAGPMTEVLIFLAFVFHEFIRFYFENQPQPQAAHMPISANNLNLKKGRN